MLDLSGRSAGERLIGDVYWNDFNENFWKIGKGDFWKIERLQEFLEPTDDSWVAFSEGRWRESLKLLEDRRPALVQHYSKIAKCGFDTWRVRVVEKPLTSYMQWECHLLRLRDELGGSVRVVDAALVDQFEQHRILPELITLGDTVMYDLIYDESGLQEGGVRHVEREQIVQCREFIRSLYELGEEMSTFFEREVAVLGPPDTVADSHGRTR